MQEPVPQGTIHLVDRDVPEMHKKVEQSLKQGGYAAIDVNPASDLSLENIRDILGKTTVHIANLPVTEESLSARTETTPGSKAISFIKERIRKLKAA